MTPHILYNMLILKKLPAFCLLLASIGVNAQIITIDSAIGVAMRIHPVVSAGQLSVQSKQIAEKSALALPNPEVNIESPTGTFYAVGVLQSFEFPTVYRQQRQLARAETALAQAGRHVQENDLRYTVRILYLDAQTTLADAGLWQEQDSVYRLMSAAAKRQFEAGEIDFLQKTNVDNEAAKVQMTAKTAVLTAENTKLQLSTYVGLPNIERLSPLYSQTTTPMSQPMNNPVIDYERQQK